MQLEPPTDDRERRHTRLLWVLALVAALPCFNEYLPFADYFGHIGYSAVVAHWFEPATRVREFFSPNPHWLLPTTLYELIALPVTQVVPSAWFANVFTALGVALMPLAAAELFAAYGRDRRRAIFLFPLVYYRCLWCGFITYAAGVTLAIWTLAQIKRLADRPADSRWQWVQLAATAFATVWTHFFPSILLSVFALVVLFTSQRSRILKVLAACAPAILFLGVWLAGLISPSAAGASAFNPPTTLKALAALATRFWAWNIDAYIGSFDDVVMVASGGLIVALTIYCVMQRTHEGRRDRGPVSLLGVAILLFMLLPMTMRSPGWWAVNVRLVPFVWVFLLTALPTTKTLPRALWVPAIVVGVLWNAYLFYDFRYYFNRVEMAGIDTVVDAIPPGKFVLALWPPNETEKHYAQNTMNHGAGVYQARRGGHVAPALSGERANVLMQQRYYPTTPSWGQANGMSCKEFGRPWDYFIVKQPAPGPGIARSTVFDGTRSDVRKIAESGLWAAYENVHCGR